MVDVVHNLSKDHVPVQFFSPMKARRDNRSACLRTLHKIPDNSLVWMRTMPPSVELCPDMIECLYRDAKRNSYQDEAIAHADNGKAETDALIGGYRDRGSNDKERMEN